MSDLQEPGRPDPHLDAERIAFAASRAREHADRELHLLERAARARDDARAQLFECEADEAYRDVVALLKEHGLCP